MAEEKIVTYEKDGKKFCKACNAALDDIIWRLKFLAYVASKLSAFEPFTEDESMGFMLCIEDIIKELRPDQKGGTV